MVKLRNLEGTVTEYAFGSEIRHVRAKTFESDDAYQEPISGGDYESLQPNVAIYGQNDIR